MDSFGSLDIGRKKIQSFLDLNTSGQNIRIDDPDRAARIVDFGVGVSTAFS